MCRFLRENRYISLRENRYISTVVWYKIATGYLVDTQLVSEVKKTKKTIFEKQENESRESEK